ncbi:MAG: DUF5818 domain-containing protein [Pseudomonadota bacterium]
MALRFIANGLEHRAAPPEREGHDHATNRTIFETHAVVSLTTRTSKGPLMATRGNSAYRRMSGRLRLNGRSAMLETAEEKLIYLAATDDLADFDGRDVVVEGELSGADRLSLTWIGLAGV